MSEETTVTQPALGDGQCIQNAKNLINCATQLATCLQDAGVRRGIQRFRVELRGVQQDQAACDLIKSVAGCLGQQQGGKLCELLQTLLGNCPEPQPVIEGDNE